MRVQLCPPSRHPHKRLRPTPQSLDAPDDPLLQFMRKEGLLMEPLWCNGSGPVAPQLADAVIDPVWGPLWMGDTQAKVASAIVNATAAAAAQRAAQVRRCGCARSLPCVSLWLGHHTVVPEECVMT